MTKSAQPLTPVSAFRISLDLKRDAAAKAAANGTNLTAVIVAALNAYIQKNDSEKK